MNKEFRRRKSVQFSWPAAFPDVFVVRVSFIPFPSPFLSVLKEKAIRVDVGVWILYPFSMTSATHMTDPLPTTLNPTPNGQEKRQNQRKKEVRTHFSQTPRTMFPHTHPSSSPSGTQHRSLSLHSRNAPKAYHDIARTGRKSVSHHSLGRPFRVLVRAAALTYFLRDLRCAISAEGRSASGRTGEANAEKGSDFVCPSFVSSLFGCAISDTLGWSGVVDSFE